MTLIDGEMIIDTVPDSGLKRRYLAYDFMALDAVPKTKVIWSYGAWSYAWYMTLIYRILLFTYFWFALLSMKPGALVIMKRDVISILSELFLGGRPLSPHHQRFALIFAVNHVCLVTFFLHMISRWAYKVHVATRFINCIEGVTSVSVCELHSTVEWPALKKLL